MKILNNLCVIKNNKWIYYKIMQKIIWVKKYQELHNKMYILDIYRIIEKF